MLPIRFEYFDKELEELIYVSILTQFKHHFTGETVYKIRQEGKSGFVFDTYISEDKLMELVEQRIQK